MLKYIRVCSDLHLEGALGRNIDTLILDMIPPDDLDAESILVLAGDISSNQIQLLNLIKTVKDRFYKVLFVPGNHETYRHNYSTWNTVTAEAFRTSMPDVLVALGCVQLYEDSGIRFIFGTLWGDGGLSLRDQAEVGYGLNDFRTIYIDGEDGIQHPFRVSDMMRIHKEQKKEIDRLLKVPFDGKSVVVTHHMPSRRLVSKRFLTHNGTDGINGGFVGDCESILAYDHAPNLWIHGHTHDTIDTDLWKTRIVGNPRGYRGEWDTNFNNYGTKIIPIGEL
jgi:hypothetical protein